MFCRRLAWSVFQNRRSKRFCRDIVEKCAQQLIEFLLAERVAQKFENQRAFGVHDVLIRGRLVVEVRRRARQAKRFVQRSEIFQAARGADFRAARRSSCFRAKRTRCIPPSPAKATRRQTISTRRSSPTIDRGFALEAFVDRIARFVEQTVRHKDHSLRRIKIKAFVVDLRDDQFLCRRSARRISSCKIRARVRAFRRIARSSASLAAFV